jgi:hypothetical protein
MAWWSSSVDTKTNYFHSGKCNTNILHTDPNPRSLARNLGNPPSPPRTSIGQESSNLTEGQKAPPFMNTGRELSENCYYFPPPEICFWRSWRSWTPVTTSPIFCRRDPPSLPCSVLHELQMSPTLPTHRISDLCASAPLEFLHYPRCRNAPAAKTWVHPGHEWAVILSCPSGCVPGGHCGELAQKLAPT